MCNYRYKNKKSNKYNKPCVLPDFYKKHIDKFEDGLLIDEDGYCLFHSTNSKWKIENDFKNKLYELINVMSDVYKQEVAFKWTYSFSGFYFPGYETIEFDDTHFNNAVDMTNCIFDCRIDFLKMKLNSLDIKNSVFNERVNFKNVNLINSLSSENSSFHNGLNFKNCDLGNIQNNLFFENCTFYNKNNSASCCIGINECEHIHYLSFKKSIIKSKIYINNTSFDSELNFDHCTIEDEFIFEKCKVNGTISFQNTEFTLEENLNPMMSGTHFSFVELNKKGKIIFKGKSALGQMMKNELSIHFKGKPEGLITFENFNLNKIYSNFRLSIPELEKEGIVEIGKGCRKYNCTTDIITIEASNSNQKLILDIITVFRNYFELQQGHNLGIEIIERTTSIIKYYYFTDEKITQEVFLDRIKQNENKLWQTFSMLTQNASEEIEVNNIEIKNCLIDIAGIFLKIGNELEYNKLSVNGFNNIFNSITVNSKSIIDTESLLKEIKYRIANFNNIVPIIKIEHMGNIYNNYGKTDQFGENNYKKIITENSNVSDELRELIFKSIDEIKKESEPDKKESKLKKFIKDYGPTIGDTAIKLISSLS